MKYQVMPDLTPIEYEALKADIEERGVLVPVEVDECGAILDGHHRVKAWQELRSEGVNVADYPRMIRAGLTEEQKRNHARSLNVLRRHLSKEQRDEVMIAMRRDGMSYRQIAEAVGVSHTEVARSTAGVTIVTPVKGSDGKQYPAQQTRRPEPSPTPGLFVSNETQQGSALGTLRKLQDEAPEVFELARAGVVNGSGARKLAKLDDDMRSVVVDKLRSGEETDVQKALRQAVDQKLSTYVPPLPTGKYRVIYADPPWSYGNTMPPGATQPDEYYRLMPTPEIAAMPVRDLAEDNAVLFLWTTSPHLEESFEVIRGWGFQYKTSFVWDKVKHNMGHYNSVRHEFLLVCVRGSCPPDVPKLFDSVQVCERGEHSVKPELFREIIDTIYPFGTRLELFARRPVDGWNVYGNEVN